MFRGKASADPYPRPASASRQTMLRMRWRTSRSSIQGPGFTPAAPSSSPAVEWRVGPGADVALPPGAPEVARRRPKGQPEAGEGIPSGERQLLPGYRRRSALRKEAAAGPAGCELVRGTGSVLERTVGIYPSVRAAK